MRLLNDDEQKLFREEYQQKETEIQKNIAVYLSALVVATGWVFGPQSKPIIQICLGNEGANIFGILILLAVNVIFTCFLTYKSIEIHEITQFIAYLSPAESALQYWESWRRSSQSLTKMAFVRQHYMLGIVLVPFWVSILLLWGTHHLIYLEPGEIVQAIQRVQSEERVKMGQVSFSASPSLSIAPVSPSVQQPLAEMTGRLSRTLHTAQISWRFVLAFHYFPLLFFTVSWLAAGRKWRDIRHQKSGTPTFEKLEELGDTDQRNKASLLE